MSKIAQYLNEHMLGEVTSSHAVRSAFSRDASVLAITPELVVFPRVTNDIRKAARFSWQLAEKGHVLPLTVRGGGTDQTGAAIGRGVIINTTAHLNTILHIALKDKDRVVHVQPGVTFKSLNDTLRWNGIFIPAYPSSASYSTIGGAVANNSGGQLSGIHGNTGDWVTRLEVVLANGDLIETSRISKRDLNKKKGLQTLEGELYRQIDGLIEDNQELITDKLSGDTTDNTGYGSISKVKNKDGSFDLTPLFIGSQGTLGIISEIVLRTEFYSESQSIVVAGLGSKEAARDAADALRALQPSSLETFDGELFDLAHAKGKVYPFFDIESTTDTVNSVIFVSFNDFSDHARARKLKKAKKIFEKLNAAVVSTDDHTIDELLAVRDVSASAFVSEDPEVSLPPLVDGASVPGDRQEEFAAAVAELGQRHHVSLPLHVRVLDNVVYTRPSLQLRRVGDKQKVFKLISEYVDIVLAHGGTVLAESGEGRLKTHAIYGRLDADVLTLFTQIRSIFDPHGTLNPGVKQRNDIKDLVEVLRPSYDQADIAAFSPTN